MARLLLAHAPASARSYDLCRLAKDAHPFTLVPAKIDLGANASNHELTAADLMNMGSLPASDPTAIAPLPVAGSTTERAELYARLARESEELADLYDAAFRALSERSQPGRLRIVCHCVREILNRLLDVLGAPQLERWDSDKALGGIVVAWEAAALPLQISPGAAGPAPVAVAEEGRELPGPVFVAVRNAVVGHRNAANYKARVDALLAQTAGDGSLGLRAPLVKEWADTSRWFVGHAHVPHPAHTHPPEAELQRYFDRFEGIIRGVLLPFYKTADDLDAILEAANF